MSNKTSTPYLGVLTEKNALKQKLGSYYHPKKDHYRDGLCPIGTISREGYEYIKKNGKVVNVKTSCVKDVGSNGKTSTELAEKLKVNPKELEKYGYSTKNKAMDRQSALIRAINEISFATTKRILVLLRTQHKAMETDKTKKIYQIYDTDIKWLTNYVEKERTKNHNKDLFKKSIKKNGMMMGGDNGMLANGTPANGTNNGNNNNSNRSTNTSNKMSLLNESTNTSYRNTITSYGSNSTSYGSNNNSNNVTGPNVLNERAAKYDIEINKELDLEQTKALIRVLSTIYIGKRDVHMTNYLNRSLLFTDNQNVVDEFKKDVVTKIYNIMKGIPIGGQISTKNNNNNYKFQFIKTDNNKIQVNILNKNNQQRLGLNEIILTIVTPELVNQAQPVSP